MAQCLYFLEKGKLLKFGIYRIISIFLFKIHFWSMHHLDSNETPAEKAIWGLLNDVACCFEQILEAAPFKTTFVQPLTS